MMAGRNTVEIILSARDQASGTVRKAFGSLESSASAAMGAIKTGAAVAGAALVTLSGFIGKVGVSYNAMMEQSLIAWETIQQSADQAKETVSRLQEMGAKTPFEFEGLDKAAKLLDMAGFKGEDLFTTLTKVGDAVSAIGGGQEELAGISLALFQISTKGKISAQEMNQLAERGIPAWHMLAEGMGLSVQEVMKLSENGKLFANEALPLIINQMGERFGGAMEKQSKTFNGMIATAKDYFKMISAELTKPLFDKLKAGMEVVLPIIGRFKDSLETKGVSGTFKEMLPPSVFQGITTLIKNLGETIKNIIPLFIPLAGIILDISKVVAGFIVELSNVLAVFSKWGGLQAVVLGLATAFATLKASMMISAALPWVIGMLNPLTRALVLTQLWTKAQAVLNATLFANPIGLVVAVIAGITVALITAYKTSETFRNAVNNAFSSVQEATTNAVNVIKSITANMWNKALESTEEFRTVLQQKISTFGVIITSGFQSAVSSSSSFFAGIGKSVADFFSKGLGEKVGEIAGAFVEQFKSGFSSFGGIVSLIAPTLTAIGLSIMGVSGPIGFLISVVVGLVGYLYRLSKTNEDVGNALSSIWTNIQSVISSVLAALKPILDVFVQSFTQMAQELGPEFQKTGQIIAESFVQLQPAFQDLGTAMKDLFSTLAGLIPSFSQIIQTVLPIAIQLFGALGGAVIEIASTVIPMYAQAFQQIFPIVLQVIQSVLPVVIQLISSIIPIILEIAQMVIPMILQAVQMVFPIVLQIIQTVLPVIISLFQTIIPIITQIAMMLIPMILQVVQMVFPIVMQIIQMVIPIVVSLLQVAATIITTVLIPAIQFILQVVQVVFPVIMSVIQTALSIITGIIQAFTAILKGDWSGAWEAVKGILSAAVNLIWSLIKDTFIGKIISSIGEFISKAIDKFNAFKDRVGEVFENIKTAITSPIETAKNVVKELVDDIQGFFNGMKLSLPNIKTPHFKLSNWSINPVDWIKNKPRIDIEWYDKGGVFYGPQIIGVGEKRPEFVGALDDLRKIVREETAVRIEPQQAAVPQYAIINIDGRQTMLAMIDYINEEQEFQNKRWSTT